MEVLLILAVLGGGAWYLSSRNSKKNLEERERREFADAHADAQRWTERLGGHFMHTAGTDTASTPATADATERFTAANSALAQATTTKQAKLTRESALEFMPYIASAREIMGMSAGPDLPPLEGQRS